MANTPVLEKQNHLLKKILNSVVEDWAFLWSDGDLAKECLAQRRELSVNIELRSEKAGYYISLMADNRFATTLAENINGEENSDGSEYDALAEMLNIIAGHIITDLLPPEEAPFKAFLPTWVKKNHSQISLFAACGLLINENEVVLQLIRMEQS